MNGVIFGSVSSSSCSSLAENYAENRKARRTKTPKINTPCVPCTPNRPPGVRTPNSKSLTEALVGKSWCGVINSPSSGDQFRRRYQTAPWQTLAATRPSSQITLGRLVLCRDCKNYADIGTAKRTTAAGCWSMTKTDLRGRCT